MKCSACQRVAYCSKTCQKTHWKKVHRRQCEERPDYMPRRCAKADQDWLTREDTPWQRQQQQVAVSAQGVHLTSVISSP